MSSRYHSRSSQTAPRRSSARGDLVGEGWIGLGAIALALIAIVALSGSTGPGLGRGSRDASQAILDTVVPAERSLAAVEAAFGALCQEPLLIALELEPDCETGVITLPDSYFTGHSNPRIRPDTREYVAAAMTTYMTRLRQLPAIWESLEAIEIRGHSDARDARGAYSTSLVGSQQRALATLLFLVGPSGIADETDRADLERLAVVSGSSFSRPPADCPEPTRECLPHWRRVEIRPVLSEPLRRGDWARTIEALRVSTGPSRARATAGMSTGEAGGAAASTGAPIPAATAASPLGTPASAIPGALRAGVAAGTARADAGGAAAPASVLDSRPEAERIPLPSTR